MRLISTAALLTVSAVALSACGGNSAGDSRDFVRIVGSSTVYPFASAVAEAAAKAGVDGVLVVDYPPEESEDFAQMLKAKGLAPIFLLAPTSTETRMDQVGRLGAGYLYYVSLKGVTGAGHLDTDDVARKVAVVRQHTSLPIGVGFGISDAQSAKAVSVHADAVVIGSAIIKLMEQQVTERKPVVPAVSSFLSGIRAAIDQNN